MYKFKIGTGWLWQFADMIGARAGLSTSRTNVATNACTLFGATNAATIATATNVPTMPPPVSYIPSLFLPFGS